MVTGGMNRLTATRIRAPDCNRFQASQPPPRGGLDRWEQLRTSEALPDLVADAH